MRFLPCLGSFIGSDLLAGILAAYVVSVRLADLETAHDHHGQLLADQLGVVAFHGLAMNDRPALSRLAAQTLAAHENLLALRDRVQGAYIMTPLGHYEMAVRILEGIERFVRDREKRLAALRGAVAAVQRLT